MTRSTVVSEVPQNEAIQPTVLQTMQSRYSEPCSTCKTASERCSMHVRDGVAVGRAEHERLQDQQVQVPWSRSACKGGAPRFGMSKETILP